MADRIHIEAQIAEVQRELEMRRSVHPEWVRRGKMRQSQADLHVEQMTAVLRTLQWLRDNRAAIVAAVKEAPL